MAPKFKRLIFDLDDTLFDTFNQLVNPAAKESCQAMIDAGLDATLDDTLAARKRFVTSRDRTDLFKKLARHLGVKPGRDINHVVRTGFDAFHHRVIREAISLFPGTQELLNDLRKKYELYLVTLGGVETQQKKIQLLKLEKYFHEIFYVDVSKEKDKKATFQKILERQPSYSPKEYLSIGNRIDSEIRDAKELGMQTLLIAHGEHSHLIPENDNEKPDYEIKSLKELSEILK